jgi:hypothetical protein
LVLVAKPGEADTWREYCWLANRSEDLVIFSPTEPYRFNVLDDELQRPGAGAGLTENILQLFMTIAEIASRGSGGGQGRDDEGYWRRSLQQLLRNAIDLLILATNRVSVPDLYRVVVGAATSYDQAGDAQWRAKSFTWKCLQKADAASKTGYQAHDFQLVADYFLLEFPGLSEKTRSIILSTFTSMVDVLNRGILRELFSTTTNLTPQDALQGRVIVVDLPVKEYAEIGTFAAVLWKYSFQRAIERRDVQKNPRPCFLFVDESQLFTTQFDAMFQTTARSSRCCTVYLTQNINNYFTAYQGESGQAQVKSLLGNLGTHVVHAIGDSDTANYIAELIGRRRIMMANGNFSHAPTHPVDDWFGTSSGAGQASSGFSEIFEFALQPSELTRMRTGGPANKFLVDALVWRGGQPFRTTGKPYLWTAFSQKETR